MAKSGVFLFQILEESLQLRPNPRCVVAKNYGKWLPTSTSELYENAKKLGSGLLDLGIEPKQRVLIIGGNSPEWLTIDLALQMIGAISVPLYPTLSDGDMEYIINHAEVVAAFCGSGELATKVAKNCRLDSSRIFTWGDPAHFISYKIPMGKGSASDPKLSEIQKQLNPKACFTIIYTSGTTGRPKGVMLSHYNVVSNVEASMPVMPLDASGRVLSFLPMCHIYERMVIFVYLKTGVEICFAESIETVGENLKEVKPQLFTTVPRLLEKVYDKILTKGYALTGIKRALFFWALELGLRFEPFKPMGWWYNAQLFIARKLIFSKWQEALGGRLSCVVVGSAALQPRLARVFWAAGIPVLEGYGLTETSPVVSCNRIGDTRVSSAGKIIEGVEVKIASDGEILIKGPNIMLGYYKEPELTSEVLSADGWLSTGDIGVLDAGNFIRITDRKKEMFKTSGGKYIAPQYIENKLKEILIVEQAMVVGDGRNFPAALLVPNFIALKEWCQHKGIAYESDSKAISLPEVLEKFEKEVELVNNSLGQTEKIKKFHLVEKAFSIENGQVTPTMKIRRKVIAEAYKNEIENFYKNF